MKLPRLALTFLLAGSSSVLAIYPTTYLKPVVLQQFHSPTAVANAGDGRIFVADQPGRIFVIEGGMMRPTPFLDISNTATNTAHRKVLGLTTNYDERGLLGLAFHPGYGNPASPGYRKFYVNYMKTYQAGIDPAPPQVGDPTTGGVTVIAEFQVSATDPNAADPTSERKLLSFTQPQTNHNGGGLAFGNDGMLYIATGDGGSSNDNNAGHTGGSAARPSDNLGNSQDKTRYLGKILCIDPLGTNGPGGQYGIPVDNPFVGAGGGVREEIYAFGIRNPWGLSFDYGTGGTGRLFCADVGQGRIEEVNLIVSGGNYGWRYMEGTERPSFSSTMAHPGGTLIDPIAQYGHPGITGTSLPLLGLSITGGHVYRGTAIPDLQGKYIFGDYGATAGSPSGRLMGLEETAPSSGVFTLTAAIPMLGGNPFSLRIMCMGQDAAGEIYVATKTSAGVQALENGLPNGGLYKLMPAPTNPAPITLEPVKDNAIFSEGELSNATGNLFAGPSSTGDDRRALLAFDLSALPAGSRFESAILQLNVNQMGTGTAAQRNSILHKLLESWGEGTSFGATDGVAATTNDATWTTRFFSTPNLWSTEGGEFNSTIVSSSLAVNGTGTWAWQSAQMVNDVHDWLSAPSGNQGWVLRSDEGTTNTTKRIDSRESASGVRPKLTLVQAAPFQKWLATYFPSYLTGQWLDPQGDLDGDGITNQIEYAYGFSPLAFNSATQFSVIAGPVASGNRTFTTTFRRDTSATDLTYKLQLSDDLASWTTIAESAGGAGATGQNGGVVDSDATLSGSIHLVTVSVTLSGTDTGRQFVRLSVVRQP